MCQCALSKICGRVDYRNSPALKAFFHGLGGSYCEPEKSGGDGTFYDWTPPADVKVFVLGSDVHYIYFLYMDTYGETIFSIREGSGELGKSELPKNIIDEWKKGIGFIENYFTEGFLYFKKKK